MKLINSCADITINTLMKCMFSSDLSVLIIEGMATEEELNEAWDIIYNEYIDIAGISQSEEFELLKSIFYLQTRLRRIELLIHIQRESIKHIGIPCIAAFSQIKFYGHKLIYDKENPDIKSFEKQLSSIELKEQRNEIELDIKLKELINNRKSDSSRFEMKKQDMIKTIIMLQKNGYFIDEDKTSAEKLALMIKSHTESLEQQTYKSK